MESCQLVLGYTTLENGSVWNTMPAHVHDRRMEAYLYFNMAPEARVLHLMGEPQQTRHLFIANEEAAISPPWSIHAGAGIGSYTFIWAMAGDNRLYGHGFRSAERSALNKSRMLQRRPVLWAMSRCSINARKDIRL
jgi:5-keto 4-deoxyuronate isomerase